MNDCFCVCSIATGSHSSHRDSNLFRKSTNVSNKLETVDVRKYAAVARLAEQGCRRCRFGTWVREQLISNENLLRAAFIWVLLGGRLGFLY